MAQLNILRFAWIIGSLGGAVSSIPCCGKKTVGGVSYTLVREQDTSDYRCQENCVYQVEGMTGAFYCFKIGDLEVVCNAGGEFQEATRVANVLTISLSAPSKCCDEKMFSGAKYVLVGQEGTLPACGNDCVYQEVAKEDNGKLFCFPTSYSDLENKCDSNNIPPLLLLGFSPWSIWSQCHGDCGIDTVGTSSRNRSCESDISDDLSCMGPTKQVQNCELSCRSISRQTSGNCPQYPENVHANGYPCKYHFLAPKSWNDAQKHCKDKYGGKLWEPASDTEYQAIINAAESQAHASLGKCRWWLGLFNWNDGSPNSIDAYLSSTVTAPPTSPPDHNEPDPPNGAISNFITVTDGNDGGTHNCVGTWYNWNKWMDHQCTRENPFICQECPPPCSCSFNGLSYPCGSTIKRNPHCCSDLICNTVGIIIENQIYGENRKPESGCCVWRGKMIRDGVEFGPWWARKVCCRGEILSKPFIWIPISQVANS